MKKIQSKSESKKSYKNEFEELDPRIHNMINNIFVIPYDLRQYIDKFKIEYEASSQVKIKLHLKSSPTFHFRTEDFNWINYGQSNQDAEENSIINRIPY